MGLNRVKRLSSIGHRCSGVISKRLRAIVLHSSPDFDVIDTEHPVLDRFDVVPDHLKFKWYSHEIGVEV